MILGEDIKLSVLDFGDSNAPDEGIHDVVNYAVLAEQLGFKRFWMGEHYIKNTLFSNPEPLIPLIAMMTKKIFVGTAGLLLRQHSVFRLACSFSLLEKMFPQRIDLGLVAPSAKPDTHANSPEAFKSTKELFQEFFDCYNQEADLAGIYTNSIPSIWHLTSSMRSFTTCKHRQNVNVSKSLFHQYSNFDPELDEIARIKERYHQHSNYCPSISIAIGCFVSYDKKKITEYKKFYRQSLSIDVFSICVIEHATIFEDRIKEISVKYQTNDIVVLNLGRSYRDKTECLESISIILN